MTPGEYTTRGFAGDHPAIDQTIDPAGFGLVQQSMFPEPVVAFLRASHERDRNRGWQGVWSVAALTTGQLDDVTGSIP